MDSIEHTVVRTRKPRGQGASRRGEILAAAKRLFVEEGVQHVTMRRLAAEVGVSATALYVYFPDKDAILQAIAAEHFAALLVELESCIRPDRATPDNLRAGLRAFAAFGLAHRDEYRLTFIRSGRRDEIDPCEKLAEADSSFAILLQTVEKMIEEGHFAPKSPLLIAEALCACVHGAVAMLLNSPCDVLSDPDELLELTIDMAIRGLYVNGVKLPLLSERR
jgi:AcrR family transcriptional regulator